MTILINGTASAVTSGTFACLDQYGRRVNLNVNILDPVESSAGNCYLVRHGRDGVAKALHLPNIQSIEEQDSAQLTEISTIIYGFDDNFVMDLGTTQRYTITFRRNQPMPSSDPQKTEGETDEHFWNRVDYTQSTSWSNGFWYDAFVHFIDGWQNLNCGFIQNGNDKQFAQTGGFHFHYNPPEQQYDNLFPVLDENVFIAGTVSMSYSGSNLQYLNISLPLAVSTMVRNQSGPPMREVIYHFTSTSSTFFTALYPVGVSSVAPYAPASWNNLSQGGVVQYWYPPGHPGEEYYPGSQVPAGINELIAAWKRPWAAYFDDASTIHGTAITIDENIRSRTSVMNYILVGHGGRGGYGIGNNPYFGYGGGGGSGGYRTGSITLDSIKHGPVVQVTLKPSIGLFYNTELILLYNDGFEYTISAGNGYAGSRATGRATVTGAVPGKGGVGGAGGFNGTDATTTAGGEGADLHEYISDFQILLSDEITRVPLVSITSSHNPPAYGGGGNGVRIKNEAIDGAKGLVFVMFMEV